MPIRTGLSTTGHSGVVSLGVRLPVAASRLRVVPFSERHVSERYLAWLNDKSLMRYSEQRHYTHDFESCRIYAQRMAEAGDLFCAIEADGIGHIGNISVICDRNNGLADLSLLIGEPAARGKGFGFEAWAVMLSALRGHGGVRKVTGGTIAANTPMIRIMEKSGMSPDGLRSRHYIIDYRPEDIVYYAAFSAQRGLR